jgi:hypothetical protein
MASIDNVAQLDAAASVRADAARILGPAVDETRMMPDFAAWR